MKTIAILAGRYLPGYKDGGPVRTLINLTECLGTKYRFKIITNDRDHGDTQAYNNIKYNQGNKIGNAEVWYLKPGGFTMNAIKALTADAEMIYICGPYDDYAYKTLFLNRIGKIKKPIIVASMGSFSIGAYKIKSIKKKFFIGVCRIIGLFNKITWSVTSELEKSDVRHIIGNNAKCVIAEDLPRKVPQLIETKTKEEDNIKIIFISRISEKKNLLYAIEVLAEVKNEVVFDIYGPIENKSYWEKCRNKLLELPDNIIWNYKGMAESEEVIQLFSKYDVFLFPTRGENFGHVIFESLAGGCIPIISDQTPWKDLERNNCGKVISLDKKNIFSRVIDELAQEPYEDILERRKQAHSYAEKKYKESIEHTGYRTLFG